jgi:hypothetical protein
MKKDQTLVVSGLLSVVMDVLVLSSTIALPDLFPYYIPHLPFCQTFPHPSLAEKRPSL